jgi:hypothetical protein
MCCPKGKCGSQYFMDTKVLDFFNKKLILDYYFVRSIIKLMPVVA